MNQDQMIEHKKKLLEYLEKECDQQRSTNNEIINRAGITASLLAGVFFLALDNCKIQSTSLQFGNITLGGTSILSFFFILAFIMLAILLLYRRNIRIIDYDWELGSVYGTSDEQPKEEWIHYCTVILFSVWENNEQVLRHKAYIFNASVAFEILAALSYAFLLNT